MNKEFISPKEFWEKETEKIQNHLTSEGTKRDTAILTIGAGAIVLSVPQVANMTNSSSIHLLWLLVASWILLLLAIFSTIFSHLISEKDMEFRLNALNDFKDNGGKGYYNAYNKWYRISIIINYISVFTLTTGIIILLVFTFINININQKVMKNNDSSNEKSEKSARLPPTDYETEKPQQETTPEQK